MAEVLHPDYLINNAGLGHFKEKWSIDVINKDTKVLEDAKAYTDEKVGTAGVDVKELNSRMLAVEKKASDNTTAIGVLNGDEQTDGSVKKMIADGIATIIADAPDSLDTLKEIADWITEHAESAADMNSRITANTTKSGENSTAIAALQTLIGTLPTGISSTTVAEYISEAVEAEKTRAMAAEKALGDRITILETFATNIATNEDIDSLFS